MVVCFLYTTIGQNLRSGASRGLVSAALPTVRHEPGGRLTLTTLVAPERIAWA